jgi:hypothetical protein
MQRVKGTGTESHGRMPRRIGAAAGNGHEE